MYNESMAATLAFLSVITYCIGAPRYQDELIAMEQQHLRFAADKTMRRMDVRREESARTRGPGGTEAGLHVVLPRLGSGYVVVQSYNDCKSALTGDCCRR